jgi:hypothetical protein
MSFPPLFISVVLTLMGLFAATLRDDLATGSSRCTATSSTLVRVSGASQPRA